MAHKEFEIEPGSITEISGANATGKTSILEAVASVVNGGHSSTLLRNGEDKGEIVIELDDGTQIKKKVNANTSTVEVKKDEFVMQSPATYIKQLFGSGFNVINFLLMETKKRVQEVLKLCPLEITAEKMREITGMDVPGLDYTEHGLKIIDKADKAIRENRTGINRLVKEYTSTAKNLEDAMGDVPANVDADIAKVQAEIDGFDKQLDLCKDELQKGKDKLISDRETELETLRSEYEKKVNLVKADTQNAIDKITADVMEKEKAILNSRALTTAKMTGLSETKAKASQIETTKKQIAEAKQKAKDNEALSKKADIALEHIERFKKDAISTLEIAGMKVSIVSDELFFDGIAYDRINHAKQVEIAFALAQHTLGELRFVIADGAESLDAETLEAVKNQATINDVQLILLSVDDNPLEIHNDDAF